MSERAYIVKWKHLPDEGVYWSPDAGAARAASWRHFSDVFDKRDYGFMEYVRDCVVRRAPEFDAAYAGRQGIIPEYVGR